MMRPKKTEQLFLKTYDEHADAIFRFCFFRLSDRDKAEEIMQESFTRTWEYLSQGKDVENIRAFVYRVAKNIIVDHFRKKKESSLDELHEQGFDVSSGDQAKWGDILDGRQALGAIQRLDEKYREVLLLRYVNDLPVKEIALIIGESENHVSVRLHRGLKQLRDFFKALPVRKKV